MRSFLYGLIILLFLPATASAQDKTVLIEFFSMPLCEYDDAYQARFEELGQDNAVLNLYCPIKFSSAEHPSAHQDPGIDFCKDRASMYRHHQHFLYGATTMAMVSGIYDSRQGFPDILSSGVRAAKAGSASIYRKLQKDGKTLSLALPDMRAQQNLDMMELVFFAYDTQESFTLIREVAHIHDADGHAHTENSTLPEHTEHTLENGLKEEITVPMSRVVRHGKVLGPWDGTPETITVELSDDIRADAYAIIAQDKPYGPVRLIATYEE